jgi:acetone monooxygenase
VESYLNFVVDRFELRRDIQLGVRVTAASYDDTTQRWTVHTDHGATYRPQFLISCAGMLSAPLTTLFPGHDDFTGQVFHTARWPKEPVDLAGKRVGVIGTAATGIQVIQTIADRVGRLTVFQRTPQYAIRMNNPQLTDADRARYRHQFHQLHARVMKTFAGFDSDLLYGTWDDLTAQERHARLEQLWHDGSLNFWVGSFPEIFTDQKVNEEISEFVRGKMRERITDSQLAGELIPTSYGFGTRRVPLETNYFEAFHRDNVELISVRNNPIQRLTPKGVQTADGRVHELDVIILATGFDAGTGALTRIDIAGRGGRTLTDDWNHDITSTLGLLIHGYPNLFTTGAPLAPAAALCNMTTCLQHQVDWITDCIQYLRQRGLREIEPTQQLQNHWVDYHDTIANATLIAHTDSWYTGSNVPGKQRRMLSFAGGVDVYHHQCEELALTGYPGFRLT